MPNFDELLQGKEASRLMKDPSKLEKLSQSTGDLESAAERAAKGDASQLAGAIRRLMNDPEGVKLIQKMRENMK